MRHGILIFLLSFLLFPLPPATAQIQQPVKWSYEIKQNGCEAELRFTARIDAGWHIYSQHTPDGGPVATSFEFEKNGKYTLLGPTQEPAPKVHFEEVFGIEVFDFEKQVVFRQKIQLHSASGFELKGFLTYMACNDNTCLPPEDVNFSFAVKGHDCAEKREPLTETPSISDAESNPEASVAPKHDAEQKPIAWSLFIRKIDASTYELDLSAKPDSEWILLSPEEKNIAVPTRIDIRLPEGFTREGEWQFDTEKAVQRSFAKGKFRGFDKEIHFVQRLKVLPEDSLKMASVEINLSYSAASDDQWLERSEAFVIPANLHQAKADGAAKADTSLLLIFLAAFLSGFVALLTPCVFPMIPMTVSFFMKTSKSRKKAVSNALIYGFSIVAIYVSLGLAVSAIFGSDALNALSTNIYFNLALFVLLIVFALSFLGAFDIVLPSSWINAADKQADRGGLIGIFFMAFTLALVSFSCTGPIIGNLLVIVSDLGFMGPFMGMLGFSMALALPFMLFAIFPGWLNSMPQSGGWLNTVKVSLGFLELALAFKFLSNADLVIQAHLLERELFLAIWIAIFSLWGLYLLGKLRLAHDGEQSYISTGRLMVAVAVFSFVIYLLPGMWGAPLKKIAGFPPPLHYSESPYGVGAAGPSPDQKLPEHASYGPHQLVVFHDYHHALEYARLSGKPLLIDFTGLACVNCRRMEDNVWSAPEVLEILRNEVVIASLYVDEKTALPESEHYVSAFDGRSIKTAGQKWSDLQKTRYQSNSQPMYLILDHAENTMNGSASYEQHGTIALFHTWLEEGIRNFKEGNTEYRPVMTAVSE